MNDGFLLADSKLEVCQEIMLHLKSIKIHHEYDARPLIVMIIIN